jgi:hypothetical protein
MAACRHRLARPASRALAVLLLGAAGAAAAEPTLSETAEIQAQPRPLEAPAAVNGLYPLWEQTGVLHRRWGGQIGYNHAQLGLGRLQIGTQPFLNFHGTYNLQLKLGLGPLTGRHRTALTAAYYRFPSAAQGRTIGLLHRSAFQTYEVVEVAPVALAHSWALVRRVDLHGAFTVMPRHAGAAADGPAWVASVGLATMAELRVSPSWSARLHGGLWGIGVERQAHVGLSFAYRGPVVLLEGGYARQASMTGESQGKYLKDGALVF